MSEDDRKEDSLQAATYREPQQHHYSAVEQIFEDHHQRVLHAAYRVTGNNSDAQDVLQTVFVRLLNRSEPPGPSETLGPYLHRAAVNASLDLLRSRRRSRAVPLEEHHAEKSTDPRPSPAQVQGGRELKGHLRFALSHLSPRAAEMFALRYFEGYTNKEIAGLLGTSQTAVGVTLHRTRSQLRKELGSYVGDKS